MQQSFADMGRDPEDGAVGALVQTDDAEVLAVCREGLELASTLSWRSYDPYDFLLSPVGEATRRRSSMAARVVLQLGRHAGERGRRLARVAPHEEPKALADFLSASVLLSSIGTGWARTYVEPLLGRLERLAVPTANGLGWGLEFPYASRFVSVPARTPNAYTTASCVAALTRGGLFCEDASWLDVARRGARMISTDLGMIRRGSGRWFRYWAGNDACIVNIQALIAACFQELGTAVGDGELIEQAQIVAESAIGAQRADGSFPYSTDARGGFVDTFHTGFVLEGLTRFAIAGGQAAAAGAVRRGVEYLRAELVSPDRLPRKAPGGAVVRDGQNVGQLVQTLAVAGAGSDHGLAREVWRAGVGSGHLRREANGRAAGWPSLRWDVSPVVLAGAHLCAATEQGRACAA